MLPPGSGTVLNVTTVLVGGGAGMLLGHRLPERTRSVVTDVLGLTTVLMAGLSAAEILSPDVSRAIPRGAVLVVLGSLLIGGIAGSLLRIEARLESLAGVVQRRVGSRGAGSDRERFIEGFLAATLLFCIGPLTILGSLDDGMGRGIDKLALKSVLDCFAAMAFASTFGVGVLFSALSVAVVQGLLTLVGVGLGSFLGAAEVGVLTATGGLMLAGIGLRLLEIRRIPVGDMLPALLVAPALTALVARL